MATSRKKLTISDIAEMAGTSKTTVSFYLNGKRDKMSQETQQRIEKVIQETRYAPNPLARGLNAKRTRLLGVIVGDITNTFSNQVIKGIQRVAHDEGYQIVCSASNYVSEDEATYVEKFIALGVDGFIVQPTAQFKSISHFITDLGKPLVFFDSKLYDFSSKWVKTDNYNATYSAIMEAVRRGYSRFMLIAADPELLSTRIERSSGFSDALEAAGYDYERLTITPDSLSVEEVRDFIADSLAKRPLDPKNPLLIFAPNCWALPTVYEALRPYYDLMPTLGLLGFDNPEWVEVAKPSVSTVSQPAYEEGKQAAGILIDIINHKETATRRELPCTTTWRDTTLG